MLEPDLNSAWSDTEPAQDSGDEQYRDGNHGTYGTRLRLTKPKKSLNAIREERLRKKLARKKGRK